MTPPIQDPSSARDQSGLGWATRQLARRPAPAVAATVSIPTASLISSTQTLSPINSGDNTVLPDLSAATFKTNTSALTKADSGAGFWGIECPGLMLIRALAWLEMRDPAPGNADGQHAVGPVQNGES